MPKTKSVKNTTKKKVLFDPSTLNQSVKDCEEKLNDIIEEENKDVEKIHELDIMIAGLPARRVKQQKQMSASMWKRVQKLRKGLEQLQKQIPKETIELFFLKKYLQNLDNAIDFAVEVVKGDEKKLKSLSLLKTSDENEWFNVLYEYSRDKKRLLCWIINNSEKYKERNLHFSFLVLSSEKLIKELFIKTDERGVESYLHDYKESCVMLHQCIKTNNVHVLKSFTLIWDIGEINEAIIYSMTERLWLSLPNLGFDNPNFGANSVIRCLLTHINDTPWDLEQKYEAFKALSCEYKILDNDEESKD